MVESASGTFARLDLRRIEPSLTTYIVGKFDRVLFDETDSTSTRVAEMAAAGAPEGVLVLARKQLSGRGRQGRTWVSPIDSGIYMSVLLRPLLTRNELPLISLMTGVACAEAIKRVCDIEVGLKWVNDLVVSGRKLGGILVEMSGNAQAVATTSESTVLPPAVVIGIGLNLNFEEANLPDELKPRIEWLDRVCGREIDANLLVAEVCNCLESHYSDLRHGLNEVILERWKARSVTLGREVRVEQGSQLIRGKALDIGPSGALKILQADGTEVSVYGGEVSLRLDDGSYA
ncbi:MAG: biotin--[acetyl-CoA-carboxylase] ligase [Candidatus Obscuribacterales bacterium]|nr:biotin--[acetyl-CoA-carboxylase] ligase [Candidatus Obscuribacterales bacterium]